MAATTKAPRPWWLYVLRCGDGTLYTGIAVDVARRLEQHREGTGARYTRGRGPLTVLARARCAGHGEALRCERAFKKLSRAAKEEVLERARGLAGFVRARTRSG